MYGLNFESENQDQLFGKRDKLSKYLVLFPHFFNLFRGRKLTEEFKGKTRLGTARVTPFE